MSLVGLETGKTIEHPNIRDPFEAAGCESFNSTGGHAASPCRVMLKETMVLQKASVQVKVHLEADEDTIGC